MVDNPPREDSRVIATAADGMVRVAFRTDGLIDSVTLAPQLKRLAMAEIADAILAALSTAQNELLRRMTDSAREADHEAAKRLSDELEKLDAEYLRQTAVYQAIGTEILKRMDG
jgi:DNA-binding protein YbaB